jgi:nicotinamidase-related amidase
MTTALLIIDPQSDFVDEGGTLQVPRAIEDMQRLSRFIVAHAQKIDKIFISLDNHPVVHISHANWFSRVSGADFWPLDKSGPSPFVNLEVENGQFIIDSSGNQYLARNQEWTINYLKFVKSLGKKHTIWPEHCIAGTQGEAVTEHLMPALRHAWNAWSDREYRDRVEWIRKGQSSYTEQYGAFREVMHYPNPLEDVYGNISVMARIAQYETLYVAGEASSHCVRDSLMQFFRFLDDCRARHIEIPLKKIVILKDCMSPVPGFEVDELEFFRICQNRYGDHYVFIEESV